MSPFCYILSSSMSRNFRKERKQLLFTLVWERWRFPKLVRLTPLASPSRTSSYQVTHEERAASEHLQGAARIFRKLRGSSGSCKDLQGATGLEHRVVNARGRRIDQDRRKYRRPQATRQGQPSYQYICYNIPAVYCYEPDNSVISHWATVRSR